MYRWLCTLALFDVTSFPSFGGALNIISSILPRNESKEYSWIIWFMNTRNTFLFITKYQENPQQGKVLSLVTCHGATPDWLFHATLCVVDMYELVSMLGFSHIGYCASSWAVFTNLKHKVVYNGTMSKFRSTWMSYNQGRRKHFDIGAASVKDNAISHCWQKSIYISYLFCACFSIKYVCF